MPDFSVIKSEKFRNLIQASSKFKALTEYQQEKHIDKLKDLPLSQQQKACEFFEQENAKEKELESGDKLKTLAKLYDELVELEEKFTKLLKSEPENKEREKDEQNLNGLLNSLNN